MYHKKHKLGSNIQYHDIGRFSNTGCSGIVLVDTLIAISVVIAIIAVMVLVDTADGVDDGELWW